MRASHGPIPTFLSLSPLSFHLTVSTYIIKDVRCSSGASPYVVFNFTFLVEDAVGRSFFFLAWQAVVTSVNHEKIGSDAFKIYIGFLKNRASVEKTKEF